MSVLSDEIKAEALSHAEPDRVNLYLKFFKCKPGEYGEGDTFAGIRNPVLRKLSKKYKDIDLSSTIKLLKDEIHEIRLLALFIMEVKFKAKKTSELERNDLAEAYLKHLNYINNWDLVDASAHHILGAWLYNNNPEILIELAQHDNLWHNRIAMIATFYNIRKNDFQLSLQIAHILLHHPHDLIHKAVGWMLREIGNRDLDTELAFLKQHYKNMPRTMLRYAIEKFDPYLRSEIMKGSF